MNSLLELKPTDAVLFLAEGNFTFSLSLVQFWTKCCPFKLIKIACTCYEVGPVSPIAEDNVRCLKNFGVHVLFSADATKCDDVVRRLEQLDPDYGTGFTKVIFMFPHVGGKSKIHLNRALLKNFATSISNHLNSEESRLFVTLCGGQGGTSLDSVKRVAGDTWQIVQMMSFGEFEMTEVDRFNLKVFPDYQSFGYRGLNKGFHSEKGMVHVFQPTSVSPDYFTHYDDCCSIEELQQKYVQQKLELFFNEKVIVRKTFDELVQEFCFVEKKVVDKDEAIILNGAYETIDQLQCPAATSASLLKPVFLVDFSLNLTKCPVTVCLLILPANKTNFMTSRPTDASKFSKRVVLPNGQVASLIHVTGLASENRHWQEIWARRISLDPPAYSHDLAFTFSRDFDRTKISDVEMATVLSSVGLETVTDFKLLDVYVDSNNLTSNTVRMVYQSFLFPLSKDKVWKIHYEKIGRFLEKIFKVKLR